MNLLSNKPKWFKRTFSVLISVVLIAIILLAANYVAQRYLVHNNSHFVPNYQKVTLTEETDYETIFLQTGLSKSAVDKLIKNDRFDEVLKAQEFFFEKHETECNALFDWFTREDRLTDDFITFYDLQPGDILVTLSTHSLGWRHGHAAVVIDEFNTVESIMLGVNSSKENSDYWSSYTNFAVLRVKGKTAEERKAVADFAMEKLVGKPYSLLSGFGIKKAPDCESKNFSLHCSYLAWYAWNNFGVDLDSDGGRLATTYDILHSDKVEIVQLYGLNPNDFI